MIGEWALSIAIGSALFSLGVFAGLGIAMHKHLEVRVRRLEEALAEHTLDALDTEEDDPPPREKKTSDTLAAIAASYGCVIIRSPSGEAYATYGTGTC